MTNKYLRTIYGVDKEGNAGSLQVDVYDILFAYPTKNPALDHLITKALCPGQRGHKDLLTDLDDIIKSAQRAKAMIVNKMACTTEVTLEDIPALTQKLEKVILERGRHAPTTRRPDIDLYKIGISPVAPTHGRSSLDGNTLCYYPDKLQAEGLLKTFQQLAQEAGIVTRAVQRYGDVDDDGILVDGPTPSENTILRSLNKGVSLYGVREANAILRGHLARDKKETTDA